MSAPKNDTEFLDRLMDLSPGRWSGSSCDRLFALARRGAAAGELVEALKDTVDLARKHMSVGGTDAAAYADFRLSKARAAILKAEGAQEKQDAD